MHVYRIEYRGYEYFPAMHAGRSDYALGLLERSFVMANTSIDAVDLLRSHHRGRIEVAIIDHICKVDFKVGGAA